MTYERAKRKISSDKLTFQNTLQIMTDSNFSNTIHYEYYNSKRKDCQQVFPKLGLENWKE